MILIDAINQLDPAFQAHAMDWLPDRLPANVRIILTALEGPAVQALRARRQPPVELPLPALAESDELDIIQGFLDRYRKALDAEQCGLLLAKPEADKPLYLLTALEELRTLGTYEEITKRIQELPGEVKPLFVWILDRLEKNDGFRDEQGQLVGHELVHHYCSENKRRGGRGL